MSGAGTKLRCSGRENGEWVPGLAHCLDKIDHEAHEVGKTYVVYGSNRWGAGHTLERAKGNFRKQGARLSDGYAVLEFDDETSFEGIDEAGRYHYKGNRPTVTEHESLRRVKR